MENNVLGREVARVRKEKKLTQQQLGKLVGLTKSSISKMENGHTKLTYEDAMILMEAMGEKLAIPTTENQSAKGESLKAYLLTTATEWFAEDKGIPLDNAFEYLMFYKGLEFLENNYRYEQTLPRVDILNDLSSICKSNGGQL
ncbi:MAG: helix-turn-helix transcriptional regulator [Bacteroidales bacterium]|nr:helix-turn-helix transcriptional regulator [Bacteroidales bacterium]